MKRLPKLVGYAAIWSAVGQTPKDGYWKRFACGAFGHSTDFDDVKALWQHDHACCVAFNGYGSRSGSVKLWEDGRGLAFEIEPREDADWIDGIISEVRAGRVRGISTGHEPLEGRVDTLSSGLAVYTVRRARLLEISLIYDPLFRETSVRLVEPPAAKAEPGAASAVIYYELHGARFAPSRSGSAVVIC